uniref:Vacuolar-sorting protein SNF8 n=1 Tax=Lepeophtheirus salmonis TaxID=72036 RepID=C1BSM7_LEPSM|nr:Vacuolar-sorting protein SNF8 [Lepeophtheirus salmonis]ADD38352.1 Vacuolar-sorting protein SNF8 [Lepeophtheirus salmonis]
MRRRTVGVGAIQRKKLDAERFKDKGSQLAENEFAEMNKQMETFRNKLEEFAQKHTSDIKKDPAFRKHFQDMCASIGVDPLASGKGFWSEMLGVGDFYYELGVQIIEVCMASSHKTGGLIELEVLRKKVALSRGKKSQEISSDDILRAIKKLKILGNGFTVIPLQSGRSLIQSVPGEMSMDQTAILQCAETNGAWISSSIVEAELGWSSSRSQHVLDQLIKEGIGWIDEQNESEPAYWIPSIFTSLSSL